MAPATRCAAPAHDTTATLAHVSSAGVCVPRLSGWHCSSAAHQHVRASVASGAAAHVAACAMGSLCDESTPRSLPHSLVSCVPCLPLHCGAKRTHACGEPIRARGGQLSVMSGGWEGGPWERVDRRWLRSFDRARGLQPRLPIAPHDGSLERDGLAGSRCVA